MTPLTPAEFAQRMKAIDEAFAYDPEKAHADADDLLAETLRALGYAEGCDAYDKIEKWYA